MPVILGPRLQTMIPGPDRKRTDTVYVYRLVYEADDPKADGCLQLWLTAGGRDVYQVVLEKDRGRRLWSCTCADHAFRGEAEDRRLCKHVRGLVSFLP